MQSPQEFAQWLTTNHPVSEPVPIPQSPHCRVTVVVPVRAERLTRIERLLRSLAHQQVTAGSIETLLVVNNPPNDGTAIWQRMYASNQRLLQSPLLNTPNVYALDQSSTGKCVAGSNVGMARQRGLIEAAARFAARNTNGLVIHTDADCWFDDPTFMNRLIWLFGHYQRLVAIGGGYTLEVAADDPEAPNLTALAPIYMLVRRYSDMYDAITTGAVRTGRPYMLGSCGMHRAFEGVLAGGFPPAGLLEDVLFGEALETYAARHSMTTDYSNRWGLNLVTAFRLSDRTDNANTKRYLAMASPNQTIMVDDAFNPGTTVPLNDAYLTRMCAAVANLPGGNARLEHLFVSSPIARLRIARP